MAAFILKIKAVIAAIIVAVGAVFGIEIKNTPVIPEDPETVSGISDEEYFEKYFEPVLRFTVASDVHIDDSGTETEEERLRLLFKSAYKYADNETYKTIDAALFVGDITDNGTVTSMKKFFGIANENCRETTFLRAVLGNHDYRELSLFTPLLLMFTGGYKTSDVDFTIGGYHFIMLNPKKDGGGYSLAQINWLDDHIKAAVLSDPTGSKPVFVFQHHHVTDTVYGSHDWGEDDLTEVLSKYPQVVDFSGHSHYPINDPRSIWQGAFTALGTGTLSYLDNGIEGFCTTSVHATDHKGGYTTGPEVAKDGAQYYIVEVSKENSILIKGYDILSDEFICEYRIRSVGNTEAFDYTDERREKSTAPAFYKSAKIEVLSVNSDSIKVEIPQATGEDQVQNYRFEAYRDDVLITVSYSLSDMFYFPAPKKIEGTLTGLESDTEYLIKCCAVNCWGKESNYLYLKVKTKSAAE